MDTNGTFGTIRDEVAVSGSPNSVSKVNFDVRSGFQFVPLLGNLVSLKMPIHRNGGVEEILVIGQVSNLETKNRWHEDATYKNLIKQRGRVPHLTGEADVTTGIMNILGAYKKTVIGGMAHYEKMKLPVPPGSGLPIGVVSAADIADIMAKEPINCFAYAGFSTGGNKVPAPIYVRHFGDYDKGGNGEAYMGGVFGPSGSGKTVMAGTLMSLYAGTEDTHGSKPLGMLLLDPQSEFSENMIAAGTGFSFDFHILMTKLTGGKFDPQKHIARLDDIQLEGVEMFVQVLHSKSFFKYMGIGQSLHKEAIELATVFLGKQENSKTWSTHLSWDETMSICVGKDNREFGDLFIEAVGSAYAVSSREERIEDIKKHWDNETLKEVWDRTSELFRPEHANGKERVNVVSVLKQALTHGQIRIIDMNPKHLALPDSFKLYIMDFIFKKMRSLLHQKYFDRHPANCLVVMDEASRYIPQEAGNDENLRKLRETLIFAVKEMRKYRCGFMFITQTVSGIAKEIFKQLHFRAYGVGLGVGSDAEHIKEREGDEAFDMYKDLPDPKLTRIYSFMIGGAILALGSSSRPMVVEGFGSDAELLEVNKHFIKNGRNGTPGYKKISISDIIGKPAAAAVPVSAGIEDLDL